MQILRFSRNYRKRTIAGDARKNVFKNLVDMVFAFSRVRGIVNANLEMLGILPALPKPGIGQ